MDQKTEYKINQGFDRGIDYIPIKNKFISKYKQLKEKYIPEGVICYSNLKLARKMIYLTIAMIQLRNGSRISEAVEAFKKFYEKDDFLTYQIVKIAKSESIKYKPDGTKFITKARYRKMMFPYKWISPICKCDKDHDYYELYKSFRVFSKRDSKKLKKGVLDFLLNNFYCNTHSLRYAFINYCIYELKRPLPDIAKFVGHSDVTQLTRYTQLKNTDKIFELDI